MNKVLAFVEKADKVIDVAGKAVDVYDKALDTADKQVKVIDRSIPVIEKGANMVLNVAERAVDAGANIIDKIVDIPFRIINKFNKGGSTSDNIKSELNIAINTIKDVEIKQNICAGNIGKLGGIVHNHDFRIGRLEGTVVQHGMRIGRLGKDIAICVKPNEVSRDACDNTIRLRNLNLNTSILACGHGRVKCANLAINVVGNRSCGCEGGCGGRRDASACGDGSDRNTQRWLGIGRKDNLATHAIGRGSCAGSNRSLCVKCGINHGLDCVGALVANEFPSGSCGVDVLLTIHKV